LNSIKMPDRSNAHMPTLRRSRHAPGQVTVFDRSGDEIELTMAQHKGVTALTWRFKEQTGH
jgi:hypothetical protein